MPVTPYFKDLDNDGIYFANQISFHKNVVLPLFEAGSKLVGGDIDWVSEKVRKIIEGFDEKKKALERGKK